MATNDKLFEIGLNVLAGIRNLSWWGCYRDRVPPDDPKLHQVCLDAADAFDTVACICEGKLFLFETDMYIEPDDKDRFDLYDLNTETYEYRSVLEGASPFELITYILMSPIYKEYNEHYDEEKLNM